MRVAFDEQIFAIQRYGGISRQFAELAKQFIQHPEYGVDLQPMNVPVVNRYLLDSPELLNRMRVTGVSSSYRALAHFFGRIRPSGIDRNNSIDVLHSTFYLPHGLAGYRQARRVVTVHDMIPELLPKTRRRLDFLTLKRQYVMQADHVICVSEATRRDLLRIFTDVTAPISVIHHGVDASFAPGTARSHRLPERYLLFVGNRGGYKDAVTLIRAFSSVAQHDEDLVLLFVGGGKFSSYETRLLGELNLMERVRQVDLPDEEMSSAYGNAEIFIFPSRIEGFGLPALEAMACGAPTVLADSSSLPEVGGDAAVYFPVGDAHALTTVISELLADAKRRDWLRSAGIDRAEGFTWAKAAQQTAAVYSELTN